MQKQVDDSTAKVAQSVRTMRDQQDIIKLLGDKVDMMMRAQRVSATAPAVRIVSFVTSSFGFFKTRMTDTKIKVQRVWVNNV